MSQRDVDQVRRIYAEWSRGRMTAGVELFDPEIRFESFMPDAGDKVVAIGPGEVEAFMREFLRDWRDYSLIGDEFSDLGEGRVLVKGRQSGKGRHSGVAVEDAMCSAWRFREGRIVQLVFDREPADALAAIDASEAAG